MNREEGNLKVLIAASGSGGHLIPALLIANEICSRSLGANIEFVGSGRPLEEAILVKAGFVRHVVKMRGIKSAGLRAYMDLAMMLPCAVLSVWRIISNFRPDVVVGVGGYSSFLPVALAAFRGIPTWIHEADIEPGLANTLLARWVSTISMAFPDCKLSKFAKAIDTGQPVRPELATIEKGSVERARSLLVTGGSQGAQAIDFAADIIAEVVSKFGVSVYHQCRAENKDRVLASYRKYGVVCEVQEFIEDMASAYAGSDLVICRAGATTVMELSVVNMPAILIPYPHANGHQRANAAYLEKAGKALVVEEERIKSDLPSALLRLLDSEGYKEMIEQSFEAPALSAAANIAEGCIRIARTS